MNQPIYYYEVYYKCRICDKKYRGFRTILTKDEEIDFILKMKEKNSIHDCADGKIGLADFIGIEKRNEK